MIRLALAGYGTVGQGVLALFHQRKESLEKRLGEEIELSLILVRNKEKVRDIDPRGVRFTEDVEEILGEETSVLIEATGDVEMAYPLMKKAIEKKIHVITANKSLLSLHLEELSQLAQESGVYLLYEASVGGGTPLIRPLQDLSLHGEIQSFRGLLSGSCNYVLTKMRKENAPYEDVVKEAKELGFLEADPTDDVGGFDTRRKLRILTSLAFRGAFDEESISLEGIDNLEARDIRALSENGYAVRLLAKAQIEDGQVQASVHPVAMPKESFLGSMDGANNGVEFFGENFLHVSFQGSGAGRYPTAHAMLADLEDVLFGLRRKESPIGKDALQLSPAGKECRYYVRGGGDSVALETMLSEESGITAPLDRKRLLSVLPEGAAAIEIGE